MTISTNELRRWLLTAAAAIWIAVAVHSFVTGEFAEGSALRKAFRILGSVGGLYLLWAAWTQRPPTAEPPAKPASPKQ